MLYVRSKGDIEATREQILGVAPGNGVKSVAEYTTLMNSSNLPELKPFIRTMLAIGMVISFLVVLLNMHTMVLERTREIGILKALGSSRLDIVKLLLGETLVLALLGGFSGIAFTYLVEAILRETTPTLQILITPGWLGGALLLALAGAAAGAVYPVVGAGTAYEETKKDGKKSSIEMSIVGSEMVGTQQGYWMEVGHAGSSAEQVTYGKMLVTPADFVFHKMIFVMPGSTQPMEMDMDGAKSHRDNLDKKRGKGHPCGK